MYKPQLTLSKLKDSTNIKQISFTYDKGIKESDFKVDFDVQILDAQADKYDVIFTLNGKESSVIDKGIIQEITTVPYMQVHDISKNIISDNTENNIEFDLLHLNYNINGIDREYNFTKGFGNAVSTDGNRTITSNTFNWNVRGNPTKLYKRVIGDKRY